MKVLWKYCDKIDIDFNLNVLLKLFFSLSIKIIFFSPILANNILPLKIYCESIVKILWYHFLLFLFSLFFYPPHTYCISFFFFSFFFSLLFFSSTHVPLHFPFFYFFPLFIPTTSSKLQNVPTFFIYLFIYFKHFSCDTHAILHSNLLDSFLFL